MKNGIIVVILVMLVFAAITLRMDNIYLNIVGIALFVVSAIVIGYSLRSKKKGHRPK